MIRWSEKPRYQFQEFGSSSTSFGGSSRNEASRTEDGKPEVGPPSAETRCHFKRRD
jgi:hypothetical protein